MRVNTFLAVLSCVVSLLLSFAIHSYSGEADLVLAIGSFICLSTSFVLGFAVTFDNLKIGLLTRSASLAILLLQLVLQFVFTTFDDVHLATYLLFSGVVMIAHIGIVYQLSKASV